jgi:hypothetical protein
MSSISEDSTLPELSAQHLERIRRHFKNAMEIQCLELLQDRNAARKIKRSHRIMESMAPNPSPSLSDMATPASKKHKFCPRDPDCSATFKKQEPYPGGLIGQTSSSSLDRGTPAAQMAAMPSPPSHSKISEISKGKAPEQSSMLQKSPSSSAKQSRPPYNISQPGQGFPPILPQGGLSTTDGLPCDLPCSLTCDLTCDFPYDFTFATPATDNVDYQPPSPTSQFSFEDLGNNSDKQSD